MRTSSRTIIAFVLGALPLAPALGFDGTPVNSRVQSAAPLGVVATQPAPAAQLNNKPVPPAAVPASAVPGPANATSSSMMVQEYVGRPEDEYTVGVLHDLDGGFINSIAVRRELDGALNARVRVANRTERRDLGESLVISSGYSHGYIGPYPEVTGPCERLAAALGVRGAVNIQCRLVDGAVQVFEINPRLSGTTSLRAMVGYNEPDVLLRRHVLGEVVPPRFAYRSARIHRSLVEKFVPEPAQNWNWAEIKSTLIFLAAMMPVQCGL